MTRGEWTRTTGAASAIVVSALLISCSSTGGSPAVAKANAGEPTIAERLAFYEAQIAGDQNLYPVWAQLAETLLDRARVTRDPADVLRAEESLKRSLAIQENYDAYKTALALANFRHRFDEAIVWGEKARRTYPDDTANLAMLVEAFAGAGRLADAQAAIDANHAQDDFFVTSARGRIATARGDREAAVREYEAAAHFARDGGVPALELWSEVRAAAVWIDAGLAERARSYLDRAEEIDPSNLDFNVHRAEYAAATGEVAAALERYDRILNAEPDPMVAAAAAELAAGHGDSARVRQWQAMAEPTLRRAIDAGEVYALGAMAKLCAATDRLDEAVALARRNCEHDREAAARALLVDLERRATSATSGR